MKKLVKKAEGGVAMTPITQNMQLAPMIQQSQQLQPITNGFDVSQLIQGFTNGQGGIGQKIGQGLSSALQGTKFAQSGFTNFMNSAKGGLATSAVNLATSFLPGADYSGAKREALAKGLDKGYDAVMSGAAMIPGVGCVCAGTRVVDNQGRFLNIEDLVQSDGILGWKDGNINRESIAGFIEPKTKQCIKITLESGTILRCSIDHPILISHKDQYKEIQISKNPRKRKIKRVYQFIEAQDIKIGDSVGIANEINYWGDFTLDNAYLIGMLIGDGNYSYNSSVQLASADPDTWQYIEQNNLGKLVQTRSNNVELRIYRIYNGTKLLRSIKIFSQTKQNKRLPDNIHIYNKESICKLLAGLFDTDGCVYFNKSKKDYKIKFSQANKILIDLIREQLLKLGIHSNIVYNKEKINNFPNSRKCTCKPYYDIVIKDKQSIINFYNNITLNISRKQDKLEQLYDYCNKGKFRDNRYLSGAKADRVIKIEDIGEQIIYNLQADTDHTYLANGIITHNTAISGIMAAGKFLTKGLDSLGIGTSRMTTGDAILDSPFLKLTPLGLANAIGAKKTDTFEADEEANEEVGASYQGSLDTFEDAGDVSGKKYGLFSRRQMKKANNQIAEAQRQQDLMTDIAEEAEEAEQASNNPFLQNKMQVSRTGGFKAAAVGEKGMKLDNNNLKWANMLLKRMAQAQNTSMMYKDGGKLNIIPTGALHKELHHIDNDNITRKGIPVVTKDENGEIDQQAEVEREELIFNSELSFRLEELRDKYNSSEDESTKDSIAIEAGKIIADELLHNTIDKGKLIKSIE